MSMQIRAGDYVRVKSGPKNIGLTGIVIHFQANSPRRLVGIPCLSCGGLSLKESGVFYVVGDSAPTFAVAEKTLKSFKKCPSCEDPQGCWHVEGDLEVIHSREKVFGSCVEEWTDVGLPNQTTVRVRRLKETVLERISRAFT